MKDQYVSVGAAATVSLENVVATLAQMSKRNIEGTDALLQKFSVKQEMIADYTRAYQHYCWPVSRVEDLTLAPFHILATKGAVHVD